MRFGGERVCSRTNIIFHGECTRSNASESGLSVCVFVDDAIRHGSLNFSSLFLPLSLSLLSLSSSPRSGEHSDAGIARRTALLSLARETCSRDVKPIYPFLRLPPTSLHAHVCTRVGKTYAVARRLWNLDTRKISLVVKIGLFRFVVIQHCSDSENASSDVGSAFS